jgi:hypothetical protein
MKNSFIISIIFNVVGYMILIGFGIVRHSPLMFWGGVLWFVLWLSSDMLDAAWKALKRFMEKRG